MKALIAFGLYAVMVVGAVVALAAVGDTNDAAGVGALGIVFGMLLGIMTIAVVSD